MRCTRVGPTRAVGRRMPRSKWGRRLELGCAVMVCLAIAACFGYGLWAVAAKRIEERKARGCWHNLYSVLCPAMQMYLADYDETFPPADAWADCLLPYLPPGQMGAFLCPAAAGTQECSYAFSAALGGAKVASVNRPGTVVMLYESDGGWNAAGGPELLPEKPRHFGGERYVFADGTGRWLLRGRLSDGSWAKEPDANYGESVKWKP